MRARELKGYLSDTIREPQEDARHVLIYAQGRSGTTLLESLLCSTGYFTGLGEPLHNYTRQVWAPTKYIRGLGRGAEGNVIVHVKGSQLTRERRHPVKPAHFLRTMQAEGWTIVHVLRRNIADQVLSECIAKARGGYHKTDDRPERTAIHIHPAEFLERYERRRTFGAQDREALSGVPHLNLVYERDLMDPSSHRKATDLVLDALRLPRRKVQTELRRIGGRDSKSMLVNYQEIAAMLKESGYNWEVNIGISAENRFDGGNA